MEAVMAFSVVIGLVLVTLVSSLVLDAVQDRKYMKFLERNRNFMDVMGGIMYYGKKE